MQSLHVCLLVCLDTIPGGCVWQSSWHHLPVLISYHDPILNHDASTTITTSWQQKMGPNDTIVIWSLVSIFQLFWFNWLIFSLMIDFLIYVLTTLLCKSTMTPTQPPPHHYHEQLLAGWEQVPKTVRQQQCHHQAEGNDNTTETQNNGGTKGKREGEANEEKGPKDVKRHLLGCL